MTGHANQENGILTKNMSEEKEVWIKLSIQNYMFSLIEKSFG